MSKEIRVNYSDFFQIRRNIETNVFLEKKDFFYELSLDMGNFIVTTTFIEGSQEFEDFQAHKLKYCNQIIKNGSIDIKTNNFLDNEKWEYYPSSHYVILPPQDKKIIIQRFLCKIPLDVVIPETNKLIVLFWKGIDEVCPYLIHGEPTPVGTPLFNPPEVLQGWIQQKYDSQQEYEKWIFVEYNEQIGIRPLYACQKFIYGSIYDISAKANINPSPMYGILTIEFPYEQLKINCELLWSKKERIEFFLEDDKEYESKFGYYTGFTTGVSEKKLISDCNFFTYNIAPGDTVKKFPGNLKTKIVSIEENVLSLEEDIFTEVNQYYVLKPFEGFVTVTGKIYDEW